MESVKAEMNFPRQPEPVRVDFTGDLRDVERYMNMIRHTVENGSFDNVVRMGNQLMIYPAAVND